MLKIIKTFSASENGTTVTEYKEGSLHDELPPVALAHGKNIDAYEKLKGKALKEEKAQLAEQDVAVETEENATEAQE